VHLLERMGILTSSTFAQLPAVAGDVAQVADLPPGVAAAFGINVDTETVTRREAKTVPAMRRGEQVITGVISSLPLVSQRLEQGEDGRTAPVQPDRTPVRRSLLEQPDPRMTYSEWVRRVSEDLVYMPWSWCRKQEETADRFPRYLVHMDWRLIRLDLHKGVLRYDGEVVPNNEIVRFDSPGNGMLYDGAVVLRTALKLEAAVRRFAELDVPLGVLRDESNATASGRVKMDDEDIDKLLDRWAAGAKKRVTRFIGRLKYERIQLDAAAIQLAQARERSDVAIAQLLNLDSSEVNAPGESSMTYVNTAAKAASRVNAIRPYMNAIAQRMSAADITPRTQKTVFDITGYVRGSVSEAVELAVLASGAPVMAQDEVRARFLDLPPLVAAAAITTGEDA
jgi:portal protein